jgi:AraC-like DNA-binding protein
MKNAKLIRAGILSSYVPLARSLQLDPFRLLQSVALDRVDLSDGQTLIPAAAVTELLERSAEASGLEDFGLRLATTRNLAHVGPVGLLLREEPTVGHALRAAERYFRLYSETLAFNLDQYEKIAVVRIGYLSISRGQTRQMTELTMGTVFRTFSALAGDAWAPESVSFSYPAPAGSTIHSSFYKTRLRFDDSFNGFFLQTSDLAAPIRTADTAMAEYIRRHVDEIVAERAVKFDATVRRLVFALLPSGRCSGELVASHLGIDRKTVNRRLAFEGETFSSVVNNVRIELARRYIKTEARSFTQTGQLLGFSGLPTFSRWFRTEFGMSPTRWREINATSA